MPTYVLIAFLLSSPNLMFTPYILIPTKSKLLEISHVRLETSNASDYRSLCCLLHLLQTGVIHAIRSSNVHSRINRIGKHKPHGIMRRCDSPVDGFGLLLESTHHPFLSAHRLPAQHLVLLLSLKRSNIGVALLLLRGCQQSQERI